MNDFKQTEDWIRRTRPDVRAGLATDDRILSDADAVMTSAWAGRRTSHFFAGRTLMKNSMRLTAAAVVLIGVALVFLFNSAPGTVALADVFDRIGQIQAYTYKMSVTVNAPTGARIFQSGVDVTMSAEYGMKLTNVSEVTTQDGTVQTVTQHAYMLAEDKTMISILPEQKLFQKIELSPEMLEDAKQQNKDPREIIRQMMNCDYTSLGLTERNGLKVQGFRTTDPAYEYGMAENLEATLWVDAENWLPVLLEMNMDDGLGGKTLVVVDDFRWNVPVEPSDFAFVIPDDYQQLNDFRIPEAGQYESMKNIKQLLLAGYAYAEKTGQWPETLNEFPGVDPAVFVNPARPDDPDGYVYIQPQQQYPSAELVVIYEKYDQWKGGINVGFGDGHVEFVKDEAQFLQQLASSNN